MKELTSLMQLHAKNIFGSRSLGRVVVFSVDDYGNVRLASRAARDRMEAAGLKAANRFDRYDALETAEDLEMLFEVLSDVKGGDGKPAVFTPFAVPCNIDFESIISDGSVRYIPEELPITFGKLVAHAGAWDLWRQGIKEGIFVPQFHGREHLNVRVFEEKLAAKDKELSICLENRSLASISNSGYSTISYTAAFDFWDIHDHEKLSGVVTDGLKAFERVFGFPAIHFNPPAGREHPRLHRALSEGGIRYIDTPLVKREHSGFGRYRRVLNYTGKRNEFGQMFLVRNVVFEPTDPRGFDWVAYALKQIEVAFKWNRPAIISSHRVNFCGLIDPDNRKEGLRALGRLLKEIVRRWPDVRFMAAHELADLVLKGERLSDN